MKEEFKDFIENIKEGKLRFSERAYIFLFCLLLSTFFWFLSALSENYTTKLSIPLKYLSLSEDFVLLKEPPKELEIEVKGSGFELLGEQMSLDRNQIEVDLAEARDAKNESYFILTQSLSSKIRQELDPDLTLITVLPDSLHLSTQSRISKKIAIRLMADLSFAKGYGKRGEPLLKPDSVLVSGPQSFIDTLTELKTEQIKIENLEDTLIKKLRLEIPTKVRGVHADVEEVEAFLAVEKFTEKSIELPIVLDSAARSLNLRTFPEKVQAYFLVPLSKYQQLSANLMKARVRLPNDFTKTKKLTIEIEQVPEYAKLNRVEPESVEYIIRK